MSPSKKVFIIQDWTGKVCFYDKVFTDFDDADGFLSEYIEGLYPGIEVGDELFYEVRGEYYITEVSNE